MKFCAHCGTLLTGLQPALDSEPLPVGTLVGNYRLIDMVGEGGMGRVYTAEHVKLGRRVAIKMLRSELSANPTAVARFFAEARAVNRISHENIVEITDFVEQPGGDNCIVMELLKGEDLSHRLMRKKTLPLPRALDIAAQVASALSAVHNAGIIHRDLKPDNIFLIERSGNPDFVKLLDFGVAKLTDPSGTGGISVHSTAAGQIIGTPEYMSPEQAGGQALDHRTDIYSLGVILYETLTGELPFQAKTFGELLIKHMTAPIPLPAQQGLAHGVKGMRDALLQDLLAKDPNHRPHSMKDVEKRMRELIDTMDLPAPPKKRASTSGSQTALRDKEGSDPPPFKAKSPSTPPPSGEAAVAKIPLAKRPTPEPKHISAVAAELTLAPAPAAQPRRRSNAEAIPIETKKEGSAPAPRFAMSSGESKPIERLAKSSAEAAPLGSTTPEADPGALAARTGTRSNPAPALARTASSDKRTDSRDGKETGVQSAIKATGTVVSHRKRNALIGGGVIALVALVLAVVKLAAGGKTTPADAAGPEIKIKFVSTPPGATVKIAGTSDVIGVTPFTKSFPKSDLVVAFQFEKDGFTPTTEQIALAEDDAVATALVAVTPPAVTPPVVTPPAVTPPTVTPPVAHGSGSANTHKASGSATTSAPNAGSALDRNGTMDPFKQLNQ